MTDKVYTEVQIRNAWLIKFFLRCYQAFGIGRHAANFVLRWSCYWRFVGGEWKRHKAPIQYTEGEFNEK